MQCSDRGNQRHINYRTVTEQFYALLTKKDTVSKLKLSGLYMAMLWMVSTVIQSLIWFITAHTAKDSAAAAARTSQ